MFQDDEYGRVYKLQVTKLSIMANADLWIIKAGGLDSKSIYTQVLNNYVACAAGDFAYNAYGKPFLKAEPQIFFNVSHNSELMVVAVTSAGELGIDVELKRRKIINPRLIAAKFFHEFEITELNNSADLLATFMQLWVIKEAFVKMHGRGIAYGLKRFYVARHRATIVAVDGRYSYNLLEIEAGVICAVVPYFEQITIRYLG